jgi:hypothetical protein
MVLLQHVDDVLAGFDGGLDNQVAGVPIRQGVDADVVVAAIAGTYSKVSAGRKPTRRLMTVASKTSYG